MFFLVVGNGSFFSVKSFSGFWKMIFGDFIVCFVGSFWKDLI